MRLQVFVCLVACEVNNYTEHECSIRAQQQGKLDKVNLLSNTPANSVGVRHDIAQQLTCNRGSAEE